MHSLEKTTTRFDLAKVDCMYHIVLYIITLQGSYAVVTCLDPARMLLARDVELVTDCEQHHDSAKVPVSAECTCVRVELRRSTVTSTGVKKDS